MQLRYCNTILKNLRRLKDVYPFLKPVDPVALNIPDYLNVIKKPMDISTVQTILDNNEYKSYTEFNEDVETIFANCAQYNGPESFVTKMAQNVQKTYHKFYEKMPMEVIRYFPSILIL